MFKFKLVQFRDGSYGARRLTIIGYQFLDLFADPQLKFAWLINSKYIQETKSKDKSLVLSRIAKYYQGADVGVLV